MPERCNTYSINESLPPTKSELRVLRLIWDGLSNKEIAARLSLSRKTVEVHRSNIFLRAGLPLGSNMILLCRWGLENGYLCHDAKLPVIRLSHLHSGPQRNHRAAIRS